MLLPKIANKLYKAGMEDSLFLQDMYAADKDRPSLNPDIVEKTIWGMWYYAYLVAKHQANWKLYIN